MALHSFSLAWSNPQTQPLQIFASIQAYIITALQIYLSISYKTIQKTIPFPLKSHHPHQTMSSPPTMLSLTYHPTPTPHTTIHPLSIPSPGPEELLVRIHTAASNPKDYAHPASQNKALNSGDDMSGVIHELGVTTSGRFHRGDRVAAFHPIGKPYGTYAEYAIAPVHTTIGIPAWMGFEDAATVPLVGFTAAVTLYRRQGFVAPWEGGNTERKERPLIVYGASSALGEFVVQLAKAAGLGPIIAVAGGSAANVAKFLDLGDGGVDVLLDYRGDREKWVAEARKALGGREVKHAVDCISASGTWMPLAELVGEGGVVSVVNGSERYDEPEVKRIEARVVYTYVGTVHEGAYKPGMPKQPPKEEVKGDVAFAEKFVVWLEGALERGQFKPHPWTKIDGGLQGVEDGLRRLKAGEAKGTKFVYNIGES